MSPLSKEGMWILSVLCFLIVVALVVPSEREDTQATFANEEKAAATETETTELNEKKNLEIKGLRIASEDIDVKNPFTYGHEKRKGTIPYDGSKAKNAPTTANPPLTDNSPKLDAPRANEKDLPKWKLKGVIIGENNSVAVLSDENVSKELQIGGTFDDKTVTAIEEDYIDYSGENGKGRLWLLP